LADSYVRGEHFQETLDWIRQVVAGHCDEQDLRQIQNAIRRAFKAESEEEYEDE
jgi:hypothetical protein